MLVFKVSRVIYIYDSETDTFYDKDFLEVEHTKHAQLSHYIKKVKLKGFDYDMPYQEVTNYVEILCNEEQEELKQKILDRIDIISNQINKAKSNREFQTAMTELKRSETFLGIIYENKLLKKEIV